jgi:hypothetical protein
LAACLAGCASGPRLPYEGQVWLKDSEEELRTAQARVQEARATRAEAEADVAAAQRVREAQGAEAEAQVKYAEATLREKERALELVEASRGCAEQALVAATAEAEVRAKLDGADPSEAKARRAQATACHSGLGQLRAVLGAMSIRRGSARAALERAQVKAAAKAPNERPRPFLE